MLLLLSFRSLFAQDVDIPPDMALIPAGAFWMGSNRGDLNESPLRKVFLSAYAMDRLEVTQKAYQTFADSTRRKIPEIARDPRFQGDDRPVVGVTWEEAEGFCKWAGKRLPTEAEWEKAARGDDGRTYPWGEEMPRMERLNFADSVKTTTSVAHHPEGASPYGVQDMAGNVGEWVRDWYDASYRSEGIERDPKGPPTGRMKVVRGGGWKSQAFFVRISARVPQKPSERSEAIGFRCAWTPVVGTEKPTTPEDPEGAKGK